MAGVTFTRSRELDVTGRRTDARGDAREAYLASTCSAPPLDCSSVVTDAKEPEIAHDRSARATSS